MTEPTEEAIERKAASVAGDDDRVEADVVKRESGVRLRTNIQAGSASERVNVTAELNARDMADLVQQLPSYREVLGEQVEWARETAGEVNGE